VRIFKSTWSTRFVAKEGITDSELKALVNDTLETGQAEAKLGGGVYKVRLVRPGEGKSGGYRVIVYLKAGSGLSFPPNAERSMSTLYPVRHIVSLFQNIIKYPWLF
jgi:hypothetical protein